MEPKLIFYPIAALVMLTYIAIWRSLWARIRAVLGKQISIHYFETYTGEPPPEKIILLSRNMTNLFEVPVLYYAICLSIWIAGLTDPIFLGLAWAFVFLRVIHTIIHTTYNKVTHRLVCYAISNICLLIMTIRTIILI